ncbi:MAG: acetylesterase [Lachnospiraceae bacterium]|nr:acetylesterase [Lachnospiraceae bacterium]
MAFITMNLMSQSLMRTVPVNVVLPVDKIAFPGMKKRPEAPFKTLYLLHGVFGSYIDWVNGTRVQRYADENNLCVVMPSGDNASYIDRPASGNNYGEFVGRELVELTRKIFPLSHRREDTFIGGLSMGGYGAIRNGLKYHETFGAIAALSSALNMEDFKNLTNESPMMIFRRDFVEAVFGDLDEALESDKNPRYLVKQLLKKKAEFPAIYLACGEEDSLLHYNQDFAAFLEENGVKATFEVGPGNHEWDFWDRYIKKAIDWLPLERAGQGINSGNVGI